MYHKVWFRNFAICLQSVRVFVTISEQTAIKKLYLFPYTVPSIINQQLHLHKFHIKTLHNNEVFLCGIYVSAIVG